MADFTRQQIEAALIDGHWRYGGLIHQKAAEALLAALGDVPSDRATGHALAARLFGEYAAALETHGAWAWALRNRFERESFVDAYLDYTNRDVSEFYAAVRDHNGALEDLLHLPSPERLAEVVRERFPEMLEEGVAEGYVARYDRLKMASELYFGHDRILIDTYNKTKHGAPMVQLDRGKSGDDRYSLVTFLLDRKLMETLENNISSMTTSITELAGLTRLLEMTGLLYEREDA
jgi:hypothetical protein